ncbi:hypothetical protein PI124_g6542 [Phytophthora idaei]|nr:hypothetical protein PI126_g4024 [Phytophthora idaei]KAG3248805.1 hypothetical protein PI124_g6542 [Phytophthora idaei]
MTPEVNSDLSAMHRFTSIYQDSSCDGAPTGVFVQLKNDCENQVASSGSHCADVYDDSNTLVGYVDEICREGRREEGFKELFGAQPFMAADYYNGAHCSTFENSVAHQLTGECEALYDGYSPFRSAIISISDGVLSWKRNEGNTKIKKRGELGCPGSSGLGYYDFEIPVAEINHCYTVPTMRGAFLFYNTTSEVKSSSSSSGSVLGGSNAGSTMTDPTDSDTSSGSLITESSTESGLDVGSIAGIVVGAVVVVVMIACLVCFLLRRNRSKSLDSRSSLRDPILGRGSAWTGSPTDGSEPSTNGPGLWNDDAIIATRIPRVQVEIEAVISRGGFGEVYSGKYNNQAVAVKMLFSEMRKDLKKVNTLLAEAKMMAGLDHPRIVSFVGVAWGSLTDLCVVSELMKGGDLRALLKEFEARKHPQGIDGDKIRIASHIAQALTYLHSLSPVVIHRDLKSKNVLLTEDLEAKLTDFGASKEQQDHTMTAGVGTMLWMAPEVMMAERYSKKADIFSFGVLLSELDLQTLPYSHARIDPETGMKLPDAVLIQKVASGELRITFSPYCLDSIVKLAEECVALDPAARPGAPMVMFRLQTIMKEAFGEGYIV